MKFAEHSEQKKPLQNGSWKVLIVDDEKDVHSITKSVLNDFVFEDKKIELISAYSGREALEILKNNPDIALVLLDVVMEEDDAGLKLVRIIRDELKNILIRIILRTGQPGYAPEKEVIINYDINDYKEKTELTSTKLYTTIYSALRSYRDLCKIEQNRLGLQKIIESTREILETRSLKLLAQGVLMQLGALYRFNSDAMIVFPEHGVALSTSKDDFEVIAGIGDFADKTQKKDFNSKTIALLDRAINEKKSIVADNCYVGYLESKCGTKELIFLSDITFDQYKKNSELIDIFMANVVVAFDNLHLNQEVICTQKEVVARLGGVVESRSQETANHVNRVATISYILSKAYGLDEEECLTIRMASPMHDVGKIAIPDAILLKPDKFTPDEWDLMKTHSRIGHEIMGDSKREIIQAASIIAHEHHEKWDGSGYPRGLKEKEIHIYGRITAIADVFDALTHRRYYKEAWPENESLDYLKQQRGKHFDPELVDLFFNHLDEIKESIKYMTD